jgi:hypothetical protein
LDWKFPIKFEFTVRDTPQQNYLAEVSLATIAGRGRAIMSAAQVPKDFMKLFWREAFQTATYLDGPVSIEVQGEFKSRIEHWDGKLPKFCQHLRKWGKAGVVKLRTVTTPKIYDRGKVCMFVGYSPNHNGDTLRMWDPDTKRVHLSRDIVWLNKMFFASEVDYVNKPITSIRDGVNSEDIDEVSNNDDEVEEEKLNEEVKMTRSGKTIRRPGRYR